MSLISVTLPTDSFWATESLRVNNHIQVDIYEPDDLVIEDECGLVQFKIGIDTASITDSVSVSTVATLYASAVRAQGATKVRVDFANRAIPNTPGTEPGTYTLTQPESYEIIPMSAGAAPVVVQEVALPVGQAFPNYVILTVTEMTDAAQYALSLVGSIFSIDNEPAGPSPFSFYGIGDSPTVVLVLAKNKNTVQVRFSEPLDVNDGVWDVSNYVFDNGLVVTEVSTVQGSIVTLKTTDQSPGVLYNLTVLGVLHVKLNDRVESSDEALQNTHYIWLVDSASISDSVSFQGSFSFSIGIGNDSEAVTDDGNSGLAYHILAYDLVGVSDASITEV